MECINPIEITSYNHLSLVFPAITVVYDIGLPTVFTLWWTKLSSVQDHCRPWSVDVLRLRISLGPYPICSIMVLEYFATFALVQNHPVMYVNIPCTMVRIWVWWQSPVLDSKRHQKNTRVLGSWNILPKSCSHPPWCSMIFRIDFAMVMKLFCIKKSDVKCW